MKQQLGVAVAVAVLVLVVAAVGGGAGAEAGAGTTVLMHLRCRPLLQRQLAVVVVAGGVEEAEEEVEVLGVSSLQQGLELMQLLASCKTWASSSNHSSSSPLRHQYHRT